MNQVNTRHVDMYMYVPTLPAGYKINRCQVLNTFYGRNLVSMNSSTVYNNIYRSSNARVNFLDSIRFHPYLLYISCMEIRVLCWFQVAHPCSVRRHAIVVSTCMYAVAEGQLIILNSWFNCWFSLPLIFQPWHMSAASLNAFHNVWLRQATNKSDLTLTINNHPLPRGAEAEV